MLRTRAMLERLALPLTLAEHVSLVDLDFGGDAPASGSLVVSFLGRSVRLRASEPGTDGCGRRRLVFAGDMADPLVDLGSLGSFRLTRLQVAVAFELEGAALAARPSFEIAGRGRLELHGLGALGADPFAFEGDLVAFPAGATDDTQVRLDFEETTVSLSVARGISLSLSLRRLYFVEDDSGPGFELTGRLGVLGLSPVLGAALADEVIPVEVAVRGDGLHITAGSVLRPLRIPLPSVERLGGGAPLDVGAVILSARGLEVTVGRELAFCVDVEIGLPSSLHAILHPGFMVRVTGGARDVELRLLTSPAKALTLTRRAGGPSDAHLRLGAHGDVFFVLPSLRVDWAARSLVAEGRFRYSDLRIPLAPVLSLLRAGGMGSLADRLPASLVLSPLGLTGAVALIGRLIEDALGKGALGAQVREEVSRLMERVDRLPRRFRESFLEIELPEELEFRLDVAADLTTRVVVSPPGGEPLEVLVPVLGPGGPELLGVALHRLALGQLLGGQVLSVEVDAEIDRFDLARIASAMSLSTTGALPPPHAMEQRLLCRDVTAILMYSAGVPALIPLFFREIGLVHRGMDGLVADVRFRLPAPRLDLSSAVRAIVAERLDVDGLLAAIPESFGEREIDLHFRSSYHEGDGTHIRARVLGVTSDGLRLQATIPDPAGGAPAGVQLDLRWSDLVGSAAGLARRAVSRRA